MGPQAEEDRGYRALRGQPLCDDPRARSPDNNLLRAFIPNMEVLRHRGYLCHCIDLSPSPGEPVYAPSGCSSAIILTIHEFCTRFGCTRSPGETKCSVQ